VQKRFKAKAFAAGASREQIALCSECDLTLDEFIKIGLEAMKGVAEELGL
jgi:predicted hydrolase (HD superfamily)